MLHINTNNRIMTNAFIFVTVFYTFFQSMFNRIGSMSNLIYVVLLIVVFGYLIEGHTKIDLGAVIAFFTILAVSMVNVLIFDIKNTQTIVPYFIFGLPMILAGALIEINDLNKKFIYNVAVIYIWFLFFYMVFKYTKISTVSTDFADYLGFAYYALPSLPIVIYHFYRKRDWLSGGTSIAGLFYLLICGTRGPILCTGLFILYCIGLSFKNKGNTKIKLFILFAFILMGVMILNLREIAEYLYPFFQKKGFSTRFFKMIIYGTGFGGSSGRDILFDSVFDNIADHPFVGTGIYSDRIFLGGTDDSYCHNLFIEIINSFGIPLGVTMILALIVLIVRAYMCADEESRALIAVFFCSTFVKLLMSSSFLLEYHFFFMIGLCCNVTLHSKKKTGMT